jgi:hypothetical protein
VTSYWKLIVLKALLSVPLYLSVGWKGCVFWVWRFLLCIFHFFVTSVAIPRVSWRHFTLSRHEKKTTSIQIFELFWSLVSILLVHYFRRNLEHSKGKVEHYPRFSIHLSPYVYFCLWSEANTDKLFIIQYQYLPRITDTRFAVKSKNETQNKWYGHTGNAETIFHTDDNWFFCTRNLLCFSFAC